MITVEEIFNCINKRLMTLHFLKNILEIKKDEITGDN